MIYTETLHLIHQILNLGDLMRYASDEREQIPGEPLIAKKKGDALFFYFESNPRIRPILALGWQYVFNEPINYMENGVERVIDRRKATIESMSDEEGEYVVFEFDNGVVVPFSDIRPTHTLRMTPMFAIGVKKK